MKRRLAVLVLMLACAIGAFAGDINAKDGMLIAPGNLALTVGFDFGLGVNAGIEMALGKFDLGDLRFTYGAKGVGSLTFGGAAMGYSIGGVGTLHFSWACLDLPESLWWVQNIDSFIGIGIGYAGVASSYSGAGGIGLMSHGGSSYFFNPNLAVTVAGGLGGSYVGVLLKL